MKGSSKQTYGLFGRDLLLLMLLIRPSLIFRNLAPIADVGREMMIINRANDVSSQCIIHFLRNCVEDNVIPFWWLWMLQIFAFIPSNFTPPWFSYLHLLQFRLFFAERCILIVDNNVHTVITISCSGSLTNYGMDHLYEKSIL